VPIKTPVIVGFNRGVPMNKRVISLVQEFLTMCSDDRVYQIINVELLLKRHPPEAVIALLVELRRDYQRELKRVIAENKTAPELNDLVAKNFRLRMAINIIRNNREEDICRKSYSSEEQRKF
jgi:hypothetical protein